MLVKARPTVLQNAGVIAEVAHYHACVTPGTRAKNFCRTQMVPRAAVEAVDVYGCIPDDVEIDRLIRSVRYQTRRLRRAASLVRQEKLTDDSPYYRDVLGHADLACAALGQLIVDHFAFTPGIELECTLHGKKWTSLNWRTG